jgi:hypothetical protein
MLAKCKKNNIKVDYTDAHQVKTTEHVPTATKRSHKARNTCNNTCDTQTEWKRCDTTLLQRHRCMQKKENRRKWAFECMSALYVKMTESVLIATKGNSKARHACNSTARTRRHQNQGDTIELGRQRYMRNIRIKKKTQKNTTFEARKTYACEI